MKGSRVIVGLVVALLYGPLVHAQTFSSGSTGADGALDLAPGATTLQLPESGTFNFTTVNIPSNSQLHFLPNFRNTPVVILAQGAVAVAGGISVSVPWVSSGAVPPNYERTPGPGGFFGGFYQGDGFGPGRGVNSSNSATRSGRWVGPLTLVPIVGGSGGAGYYYSGTGYERYVGAGGGGAIVIASSGSISITGLMLSSRMRESSQTDDQIRDK